MLRINIIWLRTLIRMFGFAAFVALFGLTALLGCASVVQAHDPAPTQVQDEPKKDEPKKEEPAQPELPPEIAETFKTPLSAEGVVETKWTGTPLKTVILRVPMDDNWNDDPTQCLGSEAARRQALAFESVLEQQIDYRPWLWRFDHPRVKRFSARLRFAGLSNLDGYDSKTARATLETALSTFGADLILTLAYGSDTYGSYCIVHMFARGKGMKGNYKANLNEFGDAKNPDKAAKQYPIHANTVLSVLASHAITEKDEAALPPVPLVAANDDALSHFVAMRECFDKGDLDGAWIEYSACLKADPKCGRAALFGMEIFRNHPSQTTPHKAVVEGIKGALATPNDVLLRGRLAYNASVWFKQKAWALAAIETALKAQPRRYELLMWKSVIITDNDQQKQKAWLLENVLPHFKDGRVEVVLGNNDALSDKLELAIEWYEKAIKIAPDDHEANFSLAIISTHHAETLQRTAAMDSSGDAQRELAVKHFDRAVWAWNRCLEIDITEQDRVLEFYARAATRDFKIIPSDDEGMTRLFLMQAARNGLSKGVGGNNFNKLVGDLLPLQQKLTRALVKEAKPDSPDYELQLIARLNFAVADADSDDAVFVLREMRKRGYRGAAYIGNIARYQALIDAADAKDKKDK
jgi:tetratricopeptide (TPR) repeat protein